MLSWLIENAGTIVVCLVLSGVVAGIIVKLKKDKKHGHSSCCGNCTSCASGACCHKS